MEARRFGYGASMPPPAYKFDPTDADIVAHYLLPLAAGLPNPHAHDAVIDADPCSCPPWELLRRHGLAGSDHAFFFGPVPERTKSGRRVVKRAVSEGEEGGGGGGGTWVVQRPAEESLLLLGDGGAEIELRYKKISLSYRSEEDARRAKGWVMDEYEINDPPAPLHGGVLSRVRITARGENKFQKHQAAAAAKKLAPGPEQPDPSNYLDDDDDGTVAANYVVMGHGEGTSGGGTLAEAVHDGFLGEMAGYYSALPMPSAGEDGGCYYSALPCAGEDGGYSGDNSNSYCSEGITFSNNYCFNDGDGSSGYFLQEDGGNGD